MSLVLEIVEPGMGPEVDFGIISFRQSSRRKFFRKDIEALRHSEVIFGPFTAFTSVHWPVFGPGNAATRWEMVFRSPRSLRSWV